MTTYRKVSARIDTNLKDEFSKTLEGIGLDYTSAVKSFAYQLVRKRAIPFESKSGRSVSRCPGKQRSPR